MKDLCQFTLKDKTTITLETLAVQVKENYVKINPLINFNSNLFFFFPLILSV